MALDSGSTLTRRSLLKAGGLALAGAAGVGLAGCGGGGKLRMAWYGSDQVHAAMKRALDLFHKKNSGIAVSTQYSQFADFWPKLSTQITGGNAPDLWRHSMTYLLEYVERGVLLDLTPYVGKEIDVSNLDKKVVDTGRIHGKYYAIGNNNISQAIFYDAKVLRDAKIDTPADAWTWDDFTRMTTRIAKAHGDGFYGTADASGSPPAFEAFVTQKGKGYFTSEGKLAFGEDDLTEWLTRWDDLRRAKAAPPPETTAEAVGFENDLVVKGKAAMSFGWDQQLLFLQPLTRAVLEPHMLPNVDGAGTPNQAVRALDFWVVSARSKKRDDAVKVIDFLLNDDGAAKAIGLNLGGPPGDRFARDVRTTVEATGKKLLDYMDAISTKATARLAPWAPGYGELIESGLNRIASDVAFRKKTVAQGVKQFFDDAHRILSS